MRATNCGGFVKEVPEQWTGLLTSSHTRWRVPAPQPGLRRGSLTYVPSGYSTRPPLFRLAVPKEGS